MIDQIARIKPTEDMPFNNPCKGTSCFSGILISSRFKKTLSPNTALDAQFLVDFGFLKKTGLKNIQSIDIAPGNKHHQSIHNLLQKLSTIIGRTEYLVQTLIGLECFIQFSSVRLKKFAIFLSKVIHLPLIIRLFRKHNVSLQPRGPFPLRRLQASGHVIIKPQSW